MALSEALFVPDVTSLEDGATRLLTLRYQGREREGFLISYQGRLRAFLNECPHWAVELDLGDGDFYDAALERIYCKNHGALFLADSGACTTGPCLGRSLTQFEVRREGDGAWIGPTELHEHG